MPWWKHQPLPSLWMLLDLGLLTLGVGGSGRRKELGEAMVGPGWVSERQAGMAGRKEGESQWGRWEAKRGLLRGKWLKPQMFPGEVRGRVRGTGCWGHRGSGGGEVGRVMLLWLLLCYS